MSIRLTVSTMLPLSFLVAISASCASAKVDLSPPTFAQTAAGAASPPSLPAASTSVLGPPPVRTGVLGSAQALGCSSDLDTMKLAIDSFLAINGRYPNSEAELVQGGLITTESKMHDIGPDGTIVPSPTSGCTH